MDFQCLGKNYFFSKGFENCSLAYGVLYNNYLINLLIDTFALKFMKRSQFP